MPTYKQKNIGACQCTQCGRFFRSSKDSVCPYCNPSSRNARRALKKEIAKARKKRQCWRCSAPTENGAELCWQCALRIAARMLDEPEI